MSGIARNPSHKAQTSSVHPLIEALTISGRSRASLSASDLPIATLSRAEELKRTQIRTLTLTSLGLRDDEIKLYEVEQLFSALHGLGQRLIFILKNNPKEVKITIGLMQHEPHDPSPIAIENLSESLRTQVKAIFPSSELSHQTWDELNRELTEISELQHLTAVIGAPSASQDQEHMPSAIEALLTSMPAQEFSLVMVADPLDSGELDREIDTTERHLDEQTRLAHTEQYVEFSVEQSEDELSARNQERAEETRRQDHHERATHEGKTRTKYKRGEVNASASAGFELKAKVFRAYLKRGSCAKIQAQHLNFKGV